MKYVGNPPPRDAWMADPERPAIDPVVQFQIPQAAQPEAVRVAEENFQRLVLEFAECKSQIEEAKELRRHQVGQAHESAATARLEATKPPAKKPDAVAAEWDAKIIGLRAELAALAEACDRAGDEMVRTVEAHRDGWQVALDQLDEDATQRLSEALDAADDALADLLPARAAPSWLETFNADSAINPHGSQTQYPGGDGRASQVLARARKYVTPEQILVGYKEGGPIFKEKVLGRPKKLRPLGTGLAS